MEGFSAKLRLVMDQLNLSRVGLARELAVDKTVVGRWLTGVNRPTGHNLTRLTDIVRRHVPGFTLAHWRGPLDALAEAIGATAPTVAAPTLTHAHPIADAPGAPLSRRAGEGFYGRASSSSPAVPKAPGLQGWEGEGGPQASPLHAAGTAADQSGPASIIPDKPSIAVLPFANMSADPGQEYFADGLTEEIITALSRIRWLFVLARSSSFAYKGQAIDARQVGRDLGVRYVLEGSVRRAGDRVRITGQLVEAASGAHLWADRFDGSIDDVFDLQDKVASSVAGVLEPALQAAETARAAGRTTGDLTAYDLYLRARAMVSSSARQIPGALALLEQAIARDPGYGPALAWAAVCCYRLIYDGRSEDPEADRLKGIDFARRALEAAGDDAGTLANTANVLAYFGEDLDAVMALIDRALALNPNSAYAWHVSATIRVRAGDPDTAIDHVETALRLSPRARIAPSLLLLGGALFYCRRFDEAVQKLLLALQEDSSSAMTYRYLAACYAQMGRLDDARKIVAQLRAITPDVIPNDISYLRNREHRELFLSGLRLAGGADAAEPSAKILPDIPPQPGAGALRRERVEPAVATALATDKPSIAVLPFTNMASSAEQEYLSDGIAEDIITALSRYPSLFVIARTSSFTYKGRAVDLKQVGRELGVRYVLEGSLRRLDNHIRVTAQLIETETGTHLWAERYDRDIAGVFAVQDEITYAVTTAIAPAIADAERHRTLRRPPDSHDAWSAYQRGLWHLSKASPEENRLAQRRFEEAISLDPNYSGNYSGLVLALMQESGLFGTLSVADAKGPIMDLALRAVALDDRDAEAHACLSWAMNFNGDYEGALAEARRALAISPNLASAHRAIGTTLIFSGDPAGGLVALETCLRLDPRDPLLAWHLNRVAIGHYFCGNYEAAIDAARQVIRTYPDFPLIYRWYAAALGQAGRTAEARAALDKAISIAPASFDMYARKRVPWHRAEDHEHMVDGLRKAGWDH